MASGSGKKRNNFPLLVVLAILVALGIGTGISVLFDNVGWWQAVGVTAGALALLLLERGRRQ